jgi:ribosomal protein S6
MAKKDKDAVETAAEELDTEHAELRVYELGFHIDPELSVEEAKKAYQGIRAVAEKAGGIVAEGEPRKIPLAYTIYRSETAGRRDFDTSYFSWMTYEADGAGHEAVVEAAKADSRIFRFLDIRSTKEEARHSAEMQELLARVPEPENAEDEVSDAEIDAALKEVAA